MSTPLSERELVLTRMINAPTSLVYQAWTDPEILPKWWGPHGTTTPICEMDVRPGGIFKTEMHTADGGIYPNQGVFLEAIPGKKVVWTDAYVDAWTPTEDPFFTGVITFEEVDGKTLLTVRALHWTKENCDKHREIGFDQGWGEMLDRLTTEMEK